MEMIELCRVCLITEHELIPFDETLLLSYNLLTNLTVSLQDGMPQSLCARCAQVVKSFIEFREKSILSESTLLKFVKDNKPKNQNEDEIELCVKQENLCIKIEDCSEYIFDECFDEPMNHSDQKEPEFTIKRKKELETKQTKPKKLGSKKKKQKLKVKVKQHQGEKCKKRAIKKAEKDFSCGICQKKYGDISELKSHLQIHMKYKECDICHERFSAWPGLLSHRLEHIPDKQGYCHLCSKQYVSSIYLEYHYLNAHNDGQPTTLSCKVCQRVYKTPKRLKCHMNSSHSQARFLCDYCSKGFAFKTTLRVHLKTHSVNKTVFCDLCAFSCNLQSNLKQHKLRKHTPGKVNCKTCDAIFISQEKLDRHKCKTKKVTCTHCGKMVSSKSIARHMQSHEAARLKCTRCPATYKSREALRVHEDRHDGVRRLQCDHCPAKFFSQSVLIKHRRTHTGEKPYVCNICSKAFTGRNNLKVHMKVHGLFLIAKKDNSEEKIGDIFK